MTSLYSNKVIELSRYVQPQITEDKRNEWVNYGEDNDYYNFLIERFKNSPTNNAIINNICKLIFGQGLGAKDAYLKAGAYASFISMISEDEIKKLITDLYLLGQASLQVHYNDKHNKIIQVYHIPQQLLRPEKCNEDGEIVGCYYSDNWQDVKKYKPKRYSMFGTSKEKIEILTIQPYSVGLKYFSYVDYQGALDYALLEEKIAEYLINEVTNSFSPTTIINFNNGQPTDEQKDEITNKVTSQLTGSTGKKLVVSFNDNEQTRTTIDSVALNNAPEHYQYLSDECRTKIMVGHNVVSPLIFGIATTTGFSANADELKNSFVLYENMVIKPKQNLIIKSLDKLLAFNEINLQLYFKTLNPFQIEKPTTELSTIKTIDDLNVEEFACNTDLSDYELVYCEDVDFDTEESLNEQIEVLNSEYEKKTWLQKFAVNTGIARPTNKDPEDGKMFISRYRYVGEVTEKSREFCQKMIKANKLYRWNDIQQMSRSVVNAGWGPKGADKYDIGLYKGGGNCHHKWQREIYQKKVDKLNKPFIPVNIQAQPKTTDTQARKQGEPQPKRDPLVYTRPIDMPNQGFLPK